MKLLRCFSILAVTFAAGSHFAYAQEGPDVFFGVGTAQAPSSNQLIDTFGDGNLYSTPKMTGTFGKAGADIMITRTSA